MLPICTNEFGVNCRVASLFGAVIKDDWPLDDIHVLNAQSLNVPKVPGF
jgi:hypothetical protein